MVVLACAVGVGTAFAAPAGGRNHFPHFSLLGERVAAKDLPPGLGILVVGPPGAKGVGPFGGPGRGPFWFGEVERPNAKLAAVAKGHWICEYELPKDPFGGGMGACTSPGAAREFGLFDVSSCGKGRPRHFRVFALLPDGVTGVQIEREDGTFGRTLPVIDNTIAFTVGRENIALRGVGDAAAEGLERKLPLAAVSRSAGRGGCSFYAFAEPKSGS